MTLAREHSHQSTRIVLEQMAKKAQENGGLYTSGVLLPNYCRAWWRIYHRI